MSSEFDLIKRFFSRPAVSARLGIGDDAAAVAPAPGCELLVSTDMLVSGTHFVADADADAVGWKTLAVNVSDMAAMAAVPRWALLSVALPQADEIWLQRFVQGLFRCADAFGVELIGGDTTRGPLTLNVTIIGEAPVGRAVTRSGARAGQDVWISGFPGRAALGLDCLLGKQALSEPGRAQCLQALHYPQPRVQLGLALRGMASAMLDVSDGLCADLGHVLRQSGVGAVLDERLLPLPLPQAVELSPQKQRAALLRGGDDYELLFCAPGKYRGVLQALALQSDIPLTCIGWTTPDAGELLMQTDSGTLQPLTLSGYDHFL